MSNTHRGSRYGLVRKLSEILRRQDILSVPVGLTGLHTEDVRYTTMHGHGSEVMPRVAFV